MVLPTFKRKEVCSEGRFGEEHWILTRKQSLKLGLVVVIKLARAGYTNHVSLTFNMYLINPPPSHQLSCQCYTRKTHECAHLTDRSRLFWDSLADSWLSSLLQCCMSVRLCVVFSRAWCTQVGRSASDWQVWVPIISFRPSEIIDLINYSHAKEQSSTIVFTVTYQDVC